MMQKYPPGRYKVGIWNQVFKKNELQDIWEFADNLIQQAQNGYADPQKEALASQLRSMDLMSLREQ